MSILCYVPDGSNGASWVKNSIPGRLELSENEAEAAEFIDGPTATAFLAARPVGALHVVQLTVNPGGHNYGKKSHN